jgi:hypothetical protein
MAEDALLTGPLEPTNEAVRHRQDRRHQALRELQPAVRHRLPQRHADQSLRPGDNYDLQNSHVIPAMIRKLHLAKLAAAHDWPGIARDEARNGTIPDELRQQLHGTSNAGLAPCLTLWGTGTPKREFLYVDDMAAASVHVMNLDKASYDAHTQPMLSHINVGTGEDLSIRELAEAVARVITHHGAVDGVTGSCHQLTLPTGSRCWWIAACSRAPRCRPTGGGRAAGDQLPDRSGARAGGHACAHRPCRAHALPAGRRLQGADHLQRRHRRSCCSW